jgi:hypothetical protein
MAKLKVVRIDGNVNEYEVTPVIEYAFENYAKMGFHKAIVENQRQSDIYWLCWEAIRRSGETVVPFGEKFIETLVSVDVVDSDPLG